MLYTVPPTPFSIPVSVSGEDLSSLINSFLQQENLLNEDKQVDFDFLIAGQYITETLQQHTQDVGTEDVVEIEYIEKQAAPWPEKMMLQNDWVSSIAVLNGCILSGSYDNVVYLWDMQGNCLESVNEHTQAVKAVDWIKKDKEKAVFISSSLDQTIQICECPLNEGRSSCLYVCKGHTKSVDCLAVHPNKMKCDVLNFIPLNFTEKDIRHNQDFINLSTTLQKDLLGIYEHSMKRFDESSSEDSDFNGEDYWRRSPTGTFRFQGLHLSESESSEDEQFLSNARTLQDHLPVDKDSLEECVRGLHEVLPSDISRARLTEIALAADCDINRALNHYFS
ncbi:ribosome biogenesis WDR12 homolog [Paramuricea clavata]|uniref:Ribosome biogenesis WDR12 homolog n=1 Tax=Paramuricea clavata TaxID=317549 RepID=A0A6S7I6W4_PARCT|nr:ribosome biogenesis WDR12 homolog [Paramuricea clavata]